MKRDLTAYDFDSDLDYELYLANLNPDSHFKNEMTEAKERFYRTLSEILDKYSFEDEENHLEEVETLWDEFAYSLSQLKADKVKEL
jgi:CRISPR/Cas system CSM-associated protein Csm2 small subunit